MKNRILAAGFLAAALALSGLNLGCTSRKSDGAGDPAKVIEESVDIAPGKPIAAQDQSKISSIGIKILGHVASAQKDIQTKSIDAAKKELSQATKLLEILKQVLPTVQIIDRVWIAKTQLSYLNTTEVEQDMVPILASMDQLYDLLPEGKAKENTMQAKNVLKKEKQKAASKAQQNLEAVEESLYPFTGRF